MKKFKTMNRKVFYICLITSIALMAGGFFCPPLGVIDGSVLTGVGCLLGFATLNVVIMGINNGTDVHVEKGDLHIDIDSQENKNENKVN